MYFIQIFKNEWNELYRIIVSKFPKKCVFSSSAVTWQQDIHAGLVLHSVQRRDRDSRVPNLYNCSNIEGKETGGHASDVHFAAIF
jgi:hypothetical protein